MKQYRTRRLIIALVTLLLIALGVSNTDASFIEPNVFEGLSDSGTIKDSDLSKLAVKGRAPKTGYAREQFGNGWNEVPGCDVRNLILARDLTDETFVEGTCDVSTGRLSDPYTGQKINFVRGTTTSGDVQIDHVVALSNAWQTGAQQLSYEKRVELANDPLNLLAVDGSTNEKKSDGDAATWLPPNKSFRCQYSKRQISVKAKYQLWVTPAERDALARELGRC